MKAGQVALLVAAVLVVGGVVVGAAQSRAAGTDSGPDPSTAPIGQPTKRLGCAIQGPLPEQACTPGAVFESVTVEQVCTPGYARGVRTVTTSTKTEVDAEDGITSHPPGAYEVDHLVSLEVGGSNAIANLLRARDVLTMAYQIGSPIIQLALALSIGPAVHPWLRSESTTTGSRLMQPQVRSVLLSSGPPEKSA
jgi:hypothetical protein